MDAIKIALIGGAAFIAYEFLYGSKTVAATPASTTPSTGAMTTNPNIPSSPTMATVTAGQLLATAGINAGTLQTASQWNWWLNKLTGIPGTDIGDTAGLPISVDQYVALLRAYATAHGLTGLGCCGAAIFNSRRANASFGDESFLSSLSGIVDALDMSASYVDAGPIIAGSGRNGSYDANTRGFYLADGLSV